MGETEREFELLRCWFARESIFGKGRLILTAPFGTLLLLLFSITGDIYNLCAAQEKFRTYFTLNFKVSGLTE